MTSILIPEYKIVILGAGGVGKSTLTTRFISGIYVDEYDPTIEDSYRKQCKIDGEICVLDILDTAGQEEYALLRDSYIKGGDGFVVVYSIDEKRSLKEAAKITDLIKKVKDSEKVPIVLVGNKCDKEDSREIETLEGEKLARQIRSGFYETSAKARTNVDNLFIQCVRRIKYYGKSHRASGGEAGKSRASRAPTSVIISNRDTSKSWLPVRQPTVVKDQTMEIVDSYYSNSEDYQVPLPSARNRSTTLIDPPATGNKRKSTKVPRPVSKQISKRKSTRRSHYARKRNKNPEGDAGSEHSYNEDSSSTSTVNDSDSSIDKERRKKSIRLVGYGSEMREMYNSSPSHLNKKVPLKTKRASAKQMAKSKRHNQGCPIL